MNMSTTKDIDLLKKDFSIYFNDNLKCILHLGSSVEIKNKPNDIDIIVILNKRETSEDVKVVREIVSKIKGVVDIQVISMEDIDSWNFSHFTHGQFFAYFLKEAKVIFGENPFINIFIPEKIVDASVFQKVQYYYCKAKNFFIKNDDINRMMNIKEYSLHQKKILLMLLDFWVTKEKIVLEKEKADFGQILTELGLDRIYEAEKEFFTLKFKEMSFARMFDLYQIVSFRILDQIKNKYR